MALRGARRTCVPCPDSGMPDAWTIIRYRDGYVHDPKLRTALVEMTFTRDQRANILYHPQPNTKAIVYEGQLAEWVFPELCTHLREAGFPESLTRYKATPGVRMALLSVAAPTGMLQAWVLPVHRQSPQLLRAIFLLEAVAHELSDGALAIYKPLGRQVLMRPPARS